MPRYGRNWIYYKTDGAGLRKTCAGLILECNLTLLYESECNSKGDERIGNPTKCGPDSEMEELNPLNKRRSRFSQDQNLHTFWTLFR